MQFQRQIVPQTASPYVQIYNKQFQEHDCSKHIRLLHEDALAYQINYRFCAGVLQVIDP